MESRPFKEAYHYMRSPTPYRWSNEDLKRHTEAMATGLIDGGYKRGAKLAVWAGNDKEIPALLLALGYTGNHMLGVDPEVSIDAIGSLLKDLKCRGLVFSPRWGNTERVPQLEALMPGVLETDKPVHVAPVDSTFRHLHHVFNLRMEAHETLLTVAHIPVYDPDPSPLPEVRRLIHADWPLFTAVRPGGDKGWQAGRTLSTHDALAFGSAINAATSVSAESTVLITAPQHTALASCAMLGAFEAGAKFVFVRPTFDAKATLESISRQRVTSLVATSEQIAELEEAAKADAASGKPVYSANFLRSVVADLAFAAGGSTPSTFMGADVIVADSALDDAALSPARA